MDSIIFVFTCFSSQPSSGRKIRGSDTHSVRKYTNIILRVREVAGLSLGPVTGYPDLKIGHDEIL